MGYQEDCEAYVLFGNPMQDAMDYEENAQYDRWDGHRTDFHDAIDSLEDLYDPGPEIDWFAELWAEQRAEDQWVAAWAEFAQPDPPF